MMIYVLYLNLLLMMKTKLLKPSSLDQGIKSYPSFFKNGTILKFIKVINMKFATSDIFIISEIINSLTEVLNFYKN